MGKIVGDLKVNPNNPRKITEAKKTQLGKSMDKYGDLSPITFNVRSGNLIGGNQRSTRFDESAKVVITKRFDPPTKKGTVAVGYILFNKERFSYREVDWDPITEKGGMVAANKNAGEWDKDSLTGILKELTSFDVDFDADLTMFDTEELEDYGVQSITVMEHQRRSAVTGVDEDDVPENKSPKRCKRGELWQLGQHRLLIDDCTVKENVERLMAGEKADMVFTDPPYGVDYQDVKKNHEKIKNDSSLANIPPLLVGLLTAECPLFICCNWKCFSVFEAVMIKAGRAPKACIIWDKGSRVQNLDRFGKQHEFILYNGPFGGQPTIDVDVWACRREVRADHPTAKPVELIERAIKAVAPVVIVFDPFLGSGSTLIACEKTGRRCFGMEIEPLYGDVIIERWEKYTGDTVKRIAPGNRR